MGDSRDETDEHPLIMLWSAAQPGIMPDIGCPAMKSRPSARAESRFKQLCCLGLGGEALMPALLAELRVLVPSFGSTFFFFDDHGTLSNVYDENPEAPAVAQLYVQEFYDRPDREMGCGFADALRGRFGVQGLEDILSVDMDTFYRSDLHNLIYRPLDYDGMIRLACWDGNHTRGGVMLSRSRGERQFSAEERRTLASLESFFAHALADRRPGETPLVESDRTGLIVANPEGKAIYSSAEGRKLLFYATHPKIEPRRGESRTDILPPALMVLCRKLSRVFSGKPTRSAPVHHHRNIWGGFTFRGQWLEGEDPSSGLIAITINHEEPLPVRLVRRAGELPLSPRQAEVCVMMANGASAETIAERLGISRHTAIAHGRWIYNVLDVHNRAELLRTLLATNTVH